MAATRGQWIQNRYDRDVMWHPFQCRPDREAGVKVRRSMAELASRAPTDSIGRLTHAAECWAYASTSAASSQLFEQGGMKYV
jgi:hypothetical protein